LRSPVKRPVDAACGILALFVPLFVLGHVSATMCTRIAEEGREGLVIVRGRGRVTQRRL